MATQPGAGVAGAARAGLYYMAPVVVASLLPLVTLPLYTRVLSPAQYGEWAIAASVGALISGVLSLGLLAGYERTYFASERDEHRRALLFSVCIVSALLQLVGLVSTVAAGPFLATRLLQKSSGWPLLAMGFGVSAAANLKMLMLTTLRSQGRAREYAWYSVDETFLGTAISLVCVLWLQWGPRGLLVGPLVAGIGVTAALAVRLRSEMDFRFDAAEVRKVLRISLPLAPRIVIGSVGNQLDRLVLGAAGNLGAVGLYAIGQRIAQVVFAFMTALQNVYQPTVYRMFFDHAAPSAIGRFLLPYAFASAGVALAAILFIDEALGVLAPESYAGAASVVGILAVHYGLMFFGKQPQLVFAERTGLVSLLSVGTVVLNAAGIYVGAMCGGGLGVALGVLAAGIVSGAISLVLATRYAQIHYPVRHVVWVFAALPLAVLAVSRIRLSGWLTPIPELVKGVLLLLFVGAGWRAGLLPSKLRRRTPSIEQPTNG